MSRRREKTEIKTSGEVKERQRNEFICKEEEERETELERDRKRQRERERNRKIERGYFCS